MGKKTIVVLSGAGVSKESGIATFREAKEGLWNNHKIEDVATPMAWLKDPALVLEFYNHRRAKVHEVDFNDAHKAIADLEEYYDVNIVTQNIDDLHERAGSTNILHLHGEILKGRSSADFEGESEDWTGDMKIGDLAKDGSQMRPDIVWFGETVPKIVDAVKIVKQADIFIVVGTSLQVYPAAGLVNELKSEEVPIYVVDPNLTPVYKKNPTEYIEKGAVEGLRELSNKLIEEANE